MQRLRKCKNPVRFKKENLIFMKRNTRKDSFLSVNLTKSNLAVCLSVLICFLGIFFALGQWMGRNEVVRIDENKKKKERPKSIFLLRNSRKNKSTEKRQDKTVEIKKEFYQTLKEYRKDEVDDSKELHLGKSAITKVELPKKKRLLLLKNTQKKAMKNVRNRKAIQKSAYSLQIASFRKLSSANDFLEKLKYKGFSAYVQIADLSQKGTWFRVRVDVPQGKNGLRNLKIKLKKNMKISEFQVIKN